MSKIYENYLSERQNVSIPKKTKKHFSNIISFILGVAITWIILSFRFTCPSCGQIRWGLKHKTEFLGKEYKICSECYDTINDGLDFLGLKLK